MDHYLIWESDVADWEKIAVDSYRFVIDQAKEHLDEVIDESQTITKRGMAILLAHISALSGLLGYLFSDKSKLRHEDSFTIVFACCIAVLSIYTFGLLLRLIYPKDVFFKGSPPREIFFKETFDGLSEQEGLKSVLFDEVVRLQDKIERMGKSNKKRFLQYKTALKISLFFIAVVIFIIVKTIYN